MDAELHELHIARVSAWLSERAGHELSVVVRSGANEVPVAIGPFLGMQEHPTAKGVFRVLFRDDRRVSLNPDEEKYVSMGAELQGVDVSNERLTLDKGTQMIEITDLGAAAPPASDSVVWPDAAVTPQTPVPFVAPAPTTASAYPPPSAPTAPQYPGPVSVPSGPAAQAVELRVKAPVYGNAMGSGFYGPVTVRVEQGWMSVSGMRSSAKGGMIVGGTALWVIGAIGLLFGLVVASGATSDSDMGAAFCLMGFGLLLLLIGLGLYFVGRARFMRGEPATLSVPLADVVGRKVRYDSNLGCLLMLVATPIIGLVVMLAMGRRIVRMTVPNDRGQRPPRQMLELKVASGAEGAILDSALRG